MKLTEALKKLLGLTEEVNAKLDKLATPATPPKAKEGDDDDDDDECSDCSGSGKCASCGGSGKMEDDACSHTEAIAKANEALTGANAKLETSEATIKDLNTKLETAQGQVNTLSAENAKLKTDLKAEKGATTAAIASTGIPADKLPEAAAAAKPAANAWEQYSALMETNPVAGAQFYQANADAIWKSRTEALNQPK